MRSRRATRSVRPGAAVRTDPAPRRRGPPARDRLPPGPGRLRTGRWSPRCAARRGPGLARPWARHPATHGSARSTRPTPRSASSSSTTAAMGAPTQRADRDVTAMVFAGQRPQRPVASVQVRIGDGLREDVDAAGVANQDGPIGDIGAGDVQVPGSPAHEAPPVVGRSSPVRARREVVAACAPACAASAPRSLAASSSAKKASPAPVASLTSANSAGPARSRRGCGCSSRHDPG